LVRSGLVLASTLSNAMSKLRRLRRQYLRMCLLTYVNPSVFGWRDSLGSSMGRSQQESSDRTTHRRAAQLAVLRHAVLESPARTDPAKRLAAAEGGLLPPPLDSYIAKVRDQSYRVSHRDIKALTTAGFSEDEIFELTVAAALGAAMLRFDAGMRALARDPA